MAFCVWRGIDLIQLRGRRLSFGREREWRERVERESGESGGREKN